VPLGATNPGAGSKRKRAISAEEIEAEKMRQWYLRPQARALNELSKPKKKRR
jgi:hypothetical protein